MILAAGKENIVRAAQMIVAGELVGFPTETVYGLGANALSASAADKIFAAKMRPADNPLIVHIADLEQLDGLVTSVNTLEKRLMAAFWPGPLSLVFPASEAVPEIVRAGLPTVAVRMPAHPVALALIRESRLPIAAPSANISGRPSATRAQDVMTDFYTTVELVLDGGVCDFGLESTVIKVEENLIRILRPGAISMEMLAGFAPVLVESFNPDEKPLSPGMKYRHYNPEARVILVEADSAAEVASRLQTINLDTEAAYFGLAVMRPPLSFKKIKLLGGSDWLHDYAQLLYSFFRDCDASGIKDIVIHQVPQSGLGYAIADRVIKAADVYLRREEGGK